MEKMGNRKANTEWATQLPEDHKPPATLCVPLLVDTHMHTTHHVDCTCSKERVEFIRNKYELKRFCAS